MWQFIIGAIVFFAGLMTGIVIYATVLESVKSKEG